MWYKKAMRNQKTVLFIIIILAFGLFLAMLIDNGFKVSFASTVPIYARAIHCAAYIALGASVLRLGQIAYQAYGDQENETTGE